MYIHIYAIDTVDIYANTTVFSVIIHEFISLKPFSLTLIPAASSQLNYAWRTCNLTQLDHNQPQAESSGDKSQI